MREAALKMVIVAGLTAQELAAGLVTKTAGPAEHKTTLSAQDIC